MEQFFLQHHLVAISCFSLAYLTLFPLSAWGQNPSESEPLRDLDRALPRQRESLPDQSPQTPQKPKLRTPQNSDLDRCQLSVE